MLPAATLSTRGINLCHFGCNDSKQGQRCPLPDEQIVWWRPHTLFYDRVSDIMSDLIWKSRLSTGPPWHFIFVKIACLKCHLSRSSRTYNWFCGPTVVKAQSNPIHPPLIRLPCSNTRIARQSEAHALVEKAGARNAYIGLMKEIWAWTDSNIPILHQINCTFAWGRGGSSELYNSVKRPVFFEQALITLGSCR